MYNFILEKSAIGTAGSVRNIVRDYELNSAYVVYGDQFYDSDFLNEVLNLKLHKIQYLQLIVVIFKNQE